MSVLVGKYTVYYSTVYCTNTAYCKVVYKILTWLEAALE